MNRTALAAVISPWALPVSYACVLAAYVRGNPFAAAPLLPGQLAMVLILAYAVTLLLGLPLWFAVTARWEVSSMAVAVTGAVIGIAVASIYRRAEAQLAFPTGFLECVGVLGGLFCALIFHRIAGRQSNPPLEPTTSIRGE